MKKVYCIGLLVCDIPLRPVPSNIFSLDRCRIEIPVWNVGGDAANVAITLSRLGAKAFLTGLTGNDMYGDFLLGQLKKSGVDIRHMGKHPTIGTGVTHIIIEPEGERHFLTNGAINNELDNSYVSDELIAESDIVYLGSCMCLNRMDSGGTAELFKKAKNLGRTTITDFGSNIEMKGDYWLSFFKPMLLNCDILMPSFNEAMVLTGKKELPDIRKALDNFGIKTLIVKMGEKGCYLTDFKDEWMIPAFPEFKAVDTTGAGDSFVAGYIRGIIEGWDNKTSARFGCCVAGHNVTKVGATAGVPDFDTAYTYMKEHGG